MLRTYKNAGKFVFVYAPVGRGGSTILDRSKVLAYYSSCKLFPTVTVIERAAISYTFPLRNVMQSGQKQTVQGHSPLRGHVPHGEKPLTVT